MSAADRAMPSIARAQLTSSVQANWRRLSAGFDLNRRTNVAGSRAWTPNFSFHQSWQEDKHTVDQRFKAAAGRGIPSPVPRASGELGTHDDVAGARQIQVRVIV